MRKIKKTVAVGEKKRMNFFQLITHSEKLVFSNYMFWSVKTCTYLQACDLWWDVFAMSKICKSTIVQEKKEKQALRVFGKGDTSRNLEAC